MRALHALFRLGLAILAVWTAPAVAGARAEGTPLPQDLPPAVQGVQVVEQLDSQVPLQAAFVDSRGRSVKIGDYFRDGRPVVMALVYYDCPMLCGLILGGLTRSMKGTGLDLGKDYRAIAVSFDPREKPPLAAVREKAYLQSLDRTESANDWPFLTGEEAASRSVADAVGFHYKYDPESKAYAHPAAIFVLTPAGKVSRYLYGIDFPSRDLRLALVEAGQGKVGTSFDRFLLTCFRYDPAARRYVPYAMGMVRAGALLVLFGLAGTLVVFWRREAKGRGR